MMNLQIDNARIDELIAGYFAQKLDKTELHELHEWLIASADNKTYFKQMQEVWFSAISANAITRFNNKKAYDRFIAAKNSYSESTDEVEEPRKSIIRFSFQRVAAAIAFLIVFGAGSYWLGAQYVNQSLAVVSVEAPLGSRTKLYLPDGTLVWLNAGSTINYSPEFGVRNRKIALQGEGYFEVTKNKHLPFDVKTSDMTVRVLGTKFNFRNYVDEEEVRVTLLEGKVSLTQGDNPEVMYLMPNELAVYDKKLKTTTISSIDASHSSEWTKGFIFFDEEKLPAIAKELERYYNVKILLSDASLQNYRFYGNFVRTEQTIQEVLDVLASTNRLKYRINGKEITLSKK